MSVNMIPIPAGYFEPESMFLTTFAFNISNVSFEDSWNSNFNGVPTARDESVFKYIPPTEIFVEEKCSNMSVCRLVTLTLRGMRRYRLRFDTIL